MTQELTIQDRRAENRPTPSSALPADGEGKGHQNHDTHAQVALPLVGPIRELHAMRQIAIRCRNRGDNAARAYARRRLGWDWDAEEKERKAVCAAAKRIVAAVYGDKPPAPGDEAAQAAVYPFVKQMQSARDMYGAYAKTLAKEMEKAAKQLPVWAAFGEKIKGFGAVALAQIVGEAGDLSHYGNPAKLWKRMGVGLVAGERQKRVRDPELAVVMGYDPERRSIVWNMGECLVKLNGDGPYRRLYDTRKEYEHERDPEMSKGHAHARAKRYMEKRLLRNLWRAWRDCRAEEREDAQ